MRLRHRHRALAALLAIAWLLGVEMLPALHLAAHDDGHTHEPDGTIVRAASIRVTFGGHRHADGTVHGAHVVGVGGTHADGVGGTHADGVGGTHADGVGGTQAGVVVVAHADGVVGTHADGVVGTHAGVVGAHADGATVHGTTTVAAKSKRRLEQLAFRTPGSAHEASGLAHHQAALSDSAPTLFAPPFVAHVTTGSAVAADQLHSRSFARPNARGPPLA